VLTGSASELRERLAELEAAGATELIWAPLGDSIERELETFAEAADLAPAAIAP